jgi:hypothetical protein
MHGSFYDCYFQNWTGGEGWQAVYGLGVLWLGFLVDILFLRFGLWELLNVLVKRRLYKRLFETSYIHSIMWISAQRE